VTTEGEEEDNGDDEEGVPGDNMEASLFLGELTSGFMLVAPGGVLPIMKALLCI